MLQLGTEIYAGLGAAGALGLAAGGYAYAALAPGSRIFGSALTAPERAEELALTFDDGPNPKWTPRLLDVLAKHNVKATFFMMGSRAQRRAGAGAAGCGGGAPDRESLVEPSEPGADGGAQSARGAGADERDAGADQRAERVEYFRPPFGARRPAVFQIARELGLRVVTWNAMTSDWSETSAERIAGELTAKIERLGRRGRAANVVLHDGGHRERAAERGASVAAAGMLVERFIGTRRFVRVDAWG